MADKRQEDLKNISEITELSGEVVSDSYDAHNQNVEATVNALLELNMNTTSREVKKSSSIQVKYQQAKRTEKSAAEQENQDPLWDQCLSLWYTDEESTKNSPLQEKSENRQGMPCGLINFRNDCYFNSLIQALFHIPEFTEIIMKALPQLINSVNNDGDYKALLISLCQRNAEDKEAQSQNALPASETTTSKTAGGDNAIEDAKKEGQQDDIFKFKFRLLESMQSLFSKMIKFPMHSQSTKEVRNVVCEASGIPINRRDDQMDLAEFYYNILDQLLDSFNPLENILVSNEDNKGQTDDSCGNSEMVNQKSTPVLDIRADKRSDKNLSAPFAKPDNKTITEINQSLAAAKRRLQSLFYGKCEYSISYTHKNKPCNKKVSEKFASISLLPKYGDLYSAWDATFDEVITNSSSSRTNEQVIAQKKYVITKLPKVLVFTINRADIDEDGDQYKNNCRFDFDDVIYPGRYLRKNTKKIKKITQAIEDYSENVKCLKILISKLRGENIKVDYNYHY
ncbi:unnamed protein product [Moneuplotes crassus]|uniref:USP domain-containing protein n=1 Tax=Euplotes crassus TaxID=5936 RepID=A0AAD2CYT9_EUPCR|nr:unnamed protein product [Moneuplotes crassus]